MSEEAIEHLRGINDDLLEACKEASELLTAGNLGQDKILIEQLNQAIAKAEGQEVPKKLTADILNEPPEIFEPEKEE